MEWEEKKAYLLSVYARSRKKKGHLAPGKKPRPVSELQTMVWVVLVIFCVILPETALKIKQSTNGERGKAEGDEGYNERTICLRFAS